MGLKYLDFLWALDFLYRYHPRCHSNEIILLADDILKWINHELPEDGSAIAYLKSCFSSPYDALNAVWNEILLQAGPFMTQN